MAYEPNYRWLIHFAQKLEELLKIPGHDHVLPRLGGTEGFPSASSEMDFALKIRLSGFPCEFSFQRGVPTPDITTQVNGQKTDVEITSLNKPYEDTVGIGALSSVTVIALQARCVSGGLWGRVPTRRELEEVTKTAQKKVAKAETEHKMVELNIPGLLTCYIAPQDLASEIPEMWRGSFVMRTKSQTPKKDRLARLITKKAKSQLSSRRPGILVVYDRFSSPDEMQGFSDEKEIELVVGTFRNLAGVILAYPFNALEPPLSRRVDKERRTYLEYSLPDAEAETCVIWGNPMFNHRSVLEPIADCLTNFPLNLSRLFGIREPL